jgi:hypothetical protein
VTTDSHASLPESPCEHQQVARRLVCYEFPFDFTRALEFALFRTFCVPSISRLFDFTGEFAQRAQKRYDDTDLLVSEIMEHGYDSGSATCISAVTSAYARPQRRKRGQSQLFTFISHVPLRVPINDSGPFSHDTHRVDTVCFLTDFAITFSTFD